MRTRRSEVSTTPVGAQRTMLRVRNSASSVIYHLIFEGSLRKITGAQLKAHLEGICLIPAEDQTLTYDGMIVEDDSTGASLGLQDKSMLDLHINKATRSPTPTRSHLLQPEATAASATTATATATAPTHTYNGNNLANEHLNRSERSVPLRFSSSRPQPAQTQTSSFMPPRAQSQLYLKAAKDSSHTKDPRDDAHRSFTSRRQPQPEDNGDEDDVVLGIEEDVIDDVDYAMHPFKDADLHEAQLEQKQYVWMMEQLRFETERMNRERELLRQRQVLENEAEVLEREKSVLSQRTLIEKRKLLELHQWIHEEMDMESRLLNVHEEGSSNYGYEGAGGNRYNHGEDSTVY